MSNQEVKTLKVRGYARRDPNTGKTVIVQSYDRASGNNESPTTLTYKRADFKPNQLDQLSDAYKLPRRTFEELTENGIYLDLEELKIIRKDINDVYLALGKNQDEDVIHNTVISSLASDAPTVSILAAHGGAEDILEYLYSVNGSDEEYKANIIDEIKTYSNQKGFYFIEDIFADSEKIWSGDIDPNLEEDIEVVDKFSGVISSPNTREIFKSRLEEFNLPDNITSYFN